MIGIHVIEPAGQKPGAIYFWVVGGEPPTWVERLYTYVTDLPEAPRAHYLPYSKNAAQAFRQAQDALRDGQRVSIDEMSDGDGKQGEADAKGSDEDEGKGGDSKTEDYKVPHLNIMSPQDFLKKE